MWHKFFSHYFWVTWVALGITSGLFLLDTFQVAESEVKFLVLPKASVAVGAPGNLMALLQSDILAKKIEMVWVAERGRMNWPTLAWDEMVSVSILPKSSVVAIAVTLPEQSDAKYLSKTIVHEAALVLSGWYDLRTDIDFRVLDGPTIEKKVGHGVYFLMTCVALGFIITSVFFLLLAVIEHILIRKERAYRAQTALSPDTFRPSASVPYASHMSESPSHLREVDAKTETLLDDTFSVTDDTFPEEVGHEAAWAEAGIHTEPYLVPELEPPLASPFAPIPSTPTIPRGPMAKGKAPDNLPVQEGDLSPLEAADARLIKVDIDTVARVEAAQAESQMGLDTNTSNGEPTQAEYKRRLNDLLSGRM